ncbi:hypothetical protein SMACR_02855 [Sordaria macrospora]|uniref:WGS project CABT00000000 data, contig 2.12 n=2 Tax=Sordaria macrospora TaxID=5147 RepID=F7VXN4_SORMK|nr:uncharacterized protein SMAC_02855 [Sordaria macrospora k-hell]KAA8632826.1 hypothetical protein SMACR_02855 [Sordaria macrospora]KAH7635028.1 hypothetical protein B0T09DRAFT_16462 [Sordaria sp. MPI-SDFR-AT-0083]WPJ58209.1 hypothetical protein SMAC4_02855 [Sordaria macrospora]CCC10278.1 unnamed protein product [Sordaria macrospora k-hell]
MAEPEQEIHVKFDPPNDIGKPTSIYSPSHTGCDFDIIAPANDPSGHWVRSHEPPFRDLRDPNVLQKALQWLSHCKERHTACRSPKYGAVQPPRQSQQSLNFYPRRLVCISVPNTTEIQLVQPSPGVPYAALSFHKSGREPGVTVQSNFEQRNSAFPIEGLPKSIQDGILVARALGFQYLWIDSLCIAFDGHAMVSEEGATWIGSSRLTDLGSGVTKQ